VKRAKTPPRKATFQEGPKAADTFMAAMKKIAIIAKKEVVSRKAAK
jgi:hypothetical protein